MKKNKLHNNTINQVKIKHNYYKSNLRIKVYNINQMIHYKDYKIQNNN